MTFPDLLQKIMTDRGLTQTPAAKMLGINQPQLSKMLNGKMKPNARVLLAIYRLDPDAFDQFARQQ